MKTTTGSLPGRSAKVQQCVVAGHTLAQCLVDRRAATTLRGREVLEQPPQPLDLHGFVIRAADQPTRSPTRAYDRQVTNTGRPGTSDLVAWLTI